MSRPTAGRPSTSTTSVETIKAWLSQTEGCRSRKRKELARRRLAARGGRGDRRGAAGRVCKRAVAAMTTHAIIKPVRRLAQRAPALTSQGDHPRNIDRQVRASEELLTWRRARQSSLSWTSCRARGVAGLSTCSTGPLRAPSRTGLQEADSFGTRLKWAAVALGLTDYPEGHSAAGTSAATSRSSTRTRSTAAEATVAADANAQSASQPPRRASATNAAAIAAAAEDEAPAAAAACARAGRGRHDATRTWSECCAHQ